MAEEKKQADESTGGSEPSEEELRNQLEEEIRKVKVEDVILQSVVSILNLAARRIAKDDERDLEQGKLGIDAASSLVRLVPEEAQPQLRQAISELQLLYAKHAEAGGGGPDESGDEKADEPGDDKTDEPEEKGGEAAADEKQGGKSGLWTPPGA